MRTHNNNFKYSPELKILCIMGISPQYVAQLESRRIVLTVEKLLKILEICNFPIERFFSPNIADYNTDKELETLIQSLNANKKKNLIEFIKNN